MEQEFSIKTSHVNKTFDSKFESVSALKNINLEIIKGAFSVIMGNSGSGKSTLLYLLSGMDQPTNGGILINSIKINGLNENKTAVFRRENIGFVFQDHNLISNLSIKENVLVAGYLVNKDRGFVKKRADLLLDQLEILSLKDRYPSEVSGGEKQRCAIARALINNPFLVIADEPTGNLNSAASQNVLECLSRLKEDRQTILMVTHDPKSAIYGNEILFMSDGEITNKINFRHSENYESRHESLLIWLKKAGW